MFAATWCLGQRLEMPPPCAVEVHARRYELSRQRLLDATALCGGGSRLLLNTLENSCALAANVNLHGASPWHR